MIDYIFGSTVNFTCLNFVEIRLKDAVNLVDVCFLSFDHHVPGFMDLSPIGTVLKSRRSGQVR